MQIGERLSIAAGFVLWGAFFTWAYIVFPEAITTEIKSQNNLGRIEVTSSHYKVYLKDSHWYEFEEPYMEVRLGEDSVCEGYNFKMDTRTGSQLKIDGRAEYRVRENKTHEQVNAGFKQCAETVINSIAAQKKINDENFLKKS